MKKTLARLSLILTLSLIGIVQLTKAQTAQTSSVNDFPQIQAATTGDALAVCNERLVKTLDALDASEKVSEARKAENESRKNLTAIQEGVIKNQDRLIEILTKQNRKKISLLYGLVKIVF